MGPESRAGQPPAGTCRARYYVVRSIDEVQACGLSLWHLELTLLGRGWHARIFHGVIAMNIGDYNERPS